MFFRLTLIAVTVLVSACSDPKAANEKNFKIAIQKTLDKTYPRCYIKADFPATVPEYGGASEKATFKALVNSGLLSEKEESRVVKGFFGSTKTVVQPVFNLTEEGKKFYKADAKKEGFGYKGGAFCFGKATVKDVPEFTEPADAGGVRASRVNYTFEVSDFPDWARSPEVLAALPRLKQDVESDKSPIKSLDMLVLTNNGWVSQSRGMGFVD